MVEGVKRSVGEDEVALRVDIVEDLPGDGREVMDVDLGIHDDDHFGVHHLAEAPEA